MRRLPPLPALRAFEAAARHGSFKHAADELAVTPTAISHQVRALEEHLGMPLFARRVRQVVLTEAGAALYPVLRDGFDAFAAALQQLAPVPARRHVTISATGAFTGRWLAPRVARFRARHPDIDLELRATDAVVDLHADAVDLAIRYGRGPYPGLVAEALLGDRFAPVASPALGPIAPADLAALPLIEFTWRRPHPDNPTWKTWFAAAGLAWRVPRGRLRFSDEDHAIQAALAGQGVALLSLALVGDELAAGRLCQPFGPTIPGHIHHLVRSAAGTARPEVDAALAWLRSEAKIT
ncbi:transcriptional regulator GcvA [Pseudoduganella armeniaca]|uniref:LysR family transcriptional regulator n=1 Tax=Pseudoduganella armeniaca TaxID=2072590 RepID=A0A2R4CFQ7_9BURK|nr:transcriptional regulator GcvA [Pseudoduganella armeniaca]AVR98446.1 LysR family transcriptional regulator [Pseudoduganella armeniaca]